MQDVPELLQRRVDASLGSDGCLVLEVEDYTLALIELPPIKPQPLASAFSRRLTDAETAVASLCLRGLTTAEIAEARSTAPKTIANQLSSIYRKLGVYSRTELASKAAAALEFVEVETDGQE